MYSGCTEQEGNTHGTMGWARGAHRVVKVGYRQVPMAGAARCSALTQGFVLGMFFGATGVA